MSRGDAKPRGAHFEFDGQLLTVAEIRERIPAFCDSAIRDHLRAGRNTTTAMLCHVKPKPKPRASSHFVINKRGYWSHGMAKRGEA